MNTDPLSQHDEVRSRLQTIAKVLTGMLPPKTGFILLVAPFDGTDEKTPGSRLNYISNIQRTDAVNTLKEWLIKAGCEEDWMRHIP